jgi:hypothetical protein
VLSEVTIEDIPEALQDRFTEEKRIEAIKKTEKSEAHLYIRLNVILEKEFYNNLGQSDLYDSSEIEFTKCVVAGGSASGAAPRSEKAVTGLRPYTM